MYLSKNKVGNYQAIRQIPPELRKVFGKIRFTRSTGTDDPKLAHQRGRAFDDEWTEIINDAFNAVKR